MDVQRQRCRGVNEGNTGIRQVGSGRDVEMGRVYASVLILTTIIQLKNAFSFGF